MVSSLHCGLMNYNNVSPSGIALNLFSGHACRMLLGKPSVIRSIF